MRKIYALGLAMLAMLAFAAVSAGLASAETPLWLNNGSEITTLTLSETTGALLLETLTILGNVGVLCSGIFDGSVGLNGEDQITEVLSLSKLNENPLNCIVESSTNANLCKVGELALVTPLHLPWATQLTLSGASIADVLGFGSAKGSEPGYLVECVTTKITNQCEGIIKGIATNTATGVLLVNPEELAATCTTGEGISEGEGEATLPGSGPLSVMEP